MSPDSRGTKLRGISIDSLDFKIPIILSDIPIHASVLFDSSFKCKSICRSLEFFIRVIFKNFQILGFYSRGIRYMTVKVDCFFNWNFSWYVFRINFQIFNVRGLKGLQIIYDFARLKKKKHYYNSLQLTCLKSSPFPQITPPYNVKFANVGCIVHHPCIFDQISLRFQIIKVLPAVSTIQ